MKLAVKEDINVKIQVPYHLFTSLFGFVLKLNLLPRVHLLSYSFIVKVCMKKMVQIFH